MTSKSPVGDISVVTLIRTDTTLDHSQEAEKVTFTLIALMSPTPKPAVWLVYFAQGQLVECCCWAKGPIKIAKMTLTIKLDGNWSSFQLANSTPPLSVTDSAIAPSARMANSLSQLTYM